MSPARGTGQAAPPTAKGSIIRATLAYVAHAAGEQSVARVLERLGADTRALAESAAATEEIPFTVVRELLRAADEELGRDDSDWAERAGDFSIDSLGMQLYGGILRKPSPADFLTQGVSLFRLFYHPGDMEVVEHEGGHVVLRLVGFDHGEPLFCQRQTGGLRRALMLAGGEDATVRHVRCAVEGDAFCEWSLTWKDVASAPRPEKAEH